MTNKKVNYKEEYQKLLNLIIDNANDVGASTLKKVQDTYNEALQKSQGEEVDKVEEKEKESWEAFL